MTSQLSRLFATVLIAGLSTSGSCDDSVGVSHDASTHPLASTLRYAKSRSDYIRRNVRDYSCRLVKRERIGGELQEHQFIQVKVRCEQRREEHVVQPMAVYMHFLAPGSMKGRKVLYVDGRNDGMVQVVKGGRALKFLKLDIDPNGTAARRESNYPITDVGFDKIIERLIERVAGDMKNDPTAANTQVSYYRDARVSDRVCTHIRVVHPRRGDGIEFHRASLYVDDELHVPIRLTVHDWPTQEGGDPPLIEEYTYVDLRLNVGLTDDDFSNTKLDTPRRMSTAASRTPR